jgi:hypothetical protein
MKKLILIFILFFSTVMFSFVFSTISYAGNLEHEKACSSIPGILECKRVAQSSYWVIVENPYQNHNYDKYGELLCYGGQRKFGVKIGYSITFWSRGQKELAKYRCY